MKAISLVPVVILSLVGCNRLCKTPSLSGQVTVAQGDSRVGSYVSSWDGFRTSSYWIEGPQGIVLIDTQFLLSAAETFVDTAEKITGKKAVLAIVLHPNPDKFNGAHVMKKRGIRVISSEQVIQRIPAVHQLRKDWFHERFKPDYPVDEPKIESFGNATQTIQAAGLSMKAHVVGAGCSEAHVAIEYEGNLFVGDLVTQGFHSWLELGLLSRWLETLDQLETLKPENVHTGRGGSGGADLIERERQYLQTVIASVKKYKPTMQNKLTPAVAERILADLTARYPAYDFPLFVENGIEAVWAGLSKQN